MLTIHHRQALRAVAEYNPVRPRHRQPILGQRCLLLLIGTALIALVIGMIEFAKWVAS